MLYVAITPWYVWTAIAVIGWSALIVFSFVRLGIKSAAMKAVIGFLFLQCLSGITAAQLTRIDAIDSLTCLVGIYGVVATLALSALQIVLVSILFMHWPQKNDGVRQGFVAWLLLWLGLNVAVFLMHARSAVLCTV